MKRIAAVVLGLLSASAAPAQDQKRDKEIVPPAPKAPPAATFGGVYQGTLTCQEIRGVTRAGYNFPLKLVVTDTQASYEREFRSDDGKRPLGVFERGAGTVAANGDIVLRGSFTSVQTKRSMTVEYRGKIEAGRARLAGTQRWSTEAGPSDRNCQIDATKG